MINRKLDKEASQLKKRADTLQDIQKDLKACDLWLLGCREIPHHRVMTRDLPVFAPVH